MQKKVLVPLANGFEEMEAVALIDVMRRGGIDVVVAGVENKTLEGANAIKIKSDTLIDDVDVSDIDMIILPGGWGGTNILSKNSKIQKILKDFNTDGKKIGAICAAPFALKTAGVLKEHYTCYPSVEEQIKVGTYINDKNIVVDDNVITSRGPGTAICFAIKIVEILVNKEVALSLKEGLLATYCYE